MYVVVMGNPFDGLEIRGPFENVDDANDWADQNLRDETWWVVEVKSL